MYPLPWEPLHFVTAQYYPPAQQTFTYHQWCEFRPPNITVVERTYNRTNFSGNLTAEEALELDNETELTYTLLETIMTDAEQGYWFPDPLNQVTYIIILRRASVCLLL